MKDLVSTNWLADHLNDADLAVLDASWHLPTAKRDASAEFLACRIPGARFFDIDDISEKATTLPHMLPTPAVFASKVGALGVGNSSHIVCYDSVGLFSAARCWWMFKVFGHDQIAVLDGGLKKWLAEERTIEDGPVSEAFGAGFMAKFRPEMVASINDVTGGISQIADARSAPRFRGEEPEPRAGVRPGHMPGAKNLHYASLLDADGTMKPIEALAQAIHGAGIDPQKQIVTSCGSGVTAAILTLGLTLINARDHALYDGSWAEWGASDKPVVTGP
jgi:thiosulfate/3-mercaptopyruvate sulfurtransferase